MGISMKKFSRMTPEQLAKYRSNVMRLHRGLLLAHVIGLSCVCLFGVGLLAYHMVTS
ncbi:hypothetical protein IB241_15720 [Pseudomonas sp. PDM05]|uniref:hypothetical protein n=1 Tax=Pseudomonas sp. PDM05 TaxID=2769301 RepID=UPI00177CE1C2|nr:hypothetical protein [Pseudomonas sp. PDM05]MBD9459131.1 hypothetical protein [Pseudomonas sp. PDM05]